MTFENAEVLRTDGLVKSPLSIAEGLIVKRVSDILCMSNLVHASKLKEHEDNDDYQ